MQQGTDYSLACFSAQPGRSDFPPFFEEEQYNYPH